MWNAIMIQIYNVGKIFERLWIELFILILMFVLARYFSSIIESSGLFSIMVTKAICMTAGVCHSLISRKMVWPYIDFATERRWDNNLMIIAWHVVIIWGWARGG